MKESMSKNTLITIAIFTGLILSSCRNNSSKIKQSDTEKNQEMITESVKTNKNDELAEKIKNYILNHFLTKADLRVISDDDRKFQFYTADLNNDGDEEVFIYFGTSYFCGSGGCTVLLLSNNMELITKFSPTQQLYIDETSENSWKVLFTNTNGSWRKLVFDGVTYPSNPTLEKSTKYSPNENTQNTFEEERNNQQVYSF